MSLRSQMHRMNPYDIHKALINHYILKKPGDTQAFSRDSSKDKTDYHVLKNNHRFLWDDENTPDTWEAQFAKKYYDKLYKEYCIGDLSLYKENKIALRWRTEQEVIVGKGQFICGNKKCNNKDDLRTWEVNFAYVESGEKKNALVKIRLCPDCSKKLNYHTKKKEVKRLKGKHRGKKRRTSAEEGGSKDGEDENVSGEQSSGEIEEEGGSGDKKVEDSPWGAQKPVEEKSRDEEMEEYLEDLLL